MKKIVWCIAAFAVLPYLLSCTNTSKKIQGEWSFIDVTYDGESMGMALGEIKTIFIGDSLMIHSSEYINDTMRVKIEKDKIYIIGMEEDEIKYKDTMTINSLSDNKLILSLSGDGHTIQHTLERPKTETEYDNEKAISPSKYKKKIIGDWKFIQRKSKRYYSDGEWKNYGEPVGWQMSFSKDGTGYQIRDNSRVVTFNWIMPADEKTIIITNTKFDDEAISIKSMTKHTMHLISENEEMKLVRVD